MKESEIKELINDKIIETAKAIEVFADSILSDRQQYTTPQLEFALNLKQMVELFYIREKSK